MSIIESIAGTSSPKQILQKAMEEPTSWSPEDMAAFKRRARELGIIPKTEKRLVFSDKQLDNLKEMDPFNRTLEIQKAVVSDMVEELFGVPIPGAMKLEAVEESDDNPPENATRPESKP